MAAIYNDTSSEVTLSGATVHAFLNINNIMKDVLEALNVTNCCRTHLVTAMIFNEHY